MFGPVANPKSIYFTVEMLCFGSAQGAPEGGMGVPPGGGFGTTKSYKSIVSAVYSVPAA